ADFHFKRNEIDNAANQRIANAKQKHECLDRLDRDDNSREHAEDAGFGTAWDRARRRWLGEQTAITRPGEMRRENGCLSIEPKDGAINVRLAREDGDVIREVTRGKVIAPIDDEVV